MLALAKHRNLEILELPDSLHKNVKEKRKEEKE
jgi:hypothetical protein